MSLVAEFSFASWMTQRLSEVEHALNNWVSTLAHAHKGVAHAAPVELVHAMRYAVLDGGKRLRPMLVLASFEAVSSGDTSVGKAAALRAACAVELIHAYSLVHDDMPCMDNDVLRRGKPTVHVQFGQASALLAGDALQALAFEILTPSDGSVAADTQARLCALLSRAAGSSGMAGGQAIDLASVGHALSEQQLREMHQLKTGALIQGSVLMGAACASPSPEALRGLTAYGEAMGLAFQVVDDILDVIADAGKLGKTAGKDAQNDKPTYVSLMGLSKSQAYAQELHASALTALHSSGLRDNQALSALADMVVNRGH